MEKFMVIIREDLIRMSKLAYEERFFNANMTSTLKWVDSLIESGNYINGEPLQLKGRYVTKDQIISDGPFIEAHEGVSGYFIIRAANLEQAAAIVQTCPLVQVGMSIMEVRPIAIVDDTNE